MLFNSFGFMFVFLPCAWAVFLAVGRFSPRLAVGWLIAASLFFYGWWNPRYVPLLAGSIAINYALGRATARARAMARGHLARAILVVALTFDLGVLAYFKYSNFLLSNFAAWAGREPTLALVVLPLGISFFTFTQVTFLVDSYRGEVDRYDWLHYALFVTYFPHLIAGPILHHREMIPQFRRESVYRASAEGTAVGVTVFIIGLFKKVVLADGVSPLVAPAFAASALGSATLVDAWGGALAYTMQIYFDFSGYSDMAVGLSRMFGIRLPMNFDSPYKAVNIAEFWRRWHMTLSRLLRDYLYIPLGGNRRGPVRRYQNLMITMVLGGLWHGAGWTFIVWGGLHGSYLATYHLWRDWRVQHASRLPAFIGQPAARLATFAAVVIGWVVFRAHDLHEAFRILHAMAGLDGLAPPGGWLSGLRDGSATAWLVVCAVVALCAPNTQQIMAQYEPALPVYRVQPHAGAFVWQPTRTAAVMIGMAAVIAIVLVNRTSQFLYFQF